MAAAIVEPPKLEDFIESIPEIADNIRAILVLHEKISPTYPEGYHGAQYPNKGIPDELTNNCTELHKLYNDLINYAKSINNELLIQRLIKNQMQLREFGNLCFMHINFDKNSVTPPVSPNISFTGGKKYLSRKRRSKTNKRKASRHRGRKESRRAATRHRRRN